MWNESFFSAPQLKRDSLGGAPVYRMVWQFASEFMELSCSRKDGSVRIFDVRTEGVADPEGEVWFFYARPKEYTGKQQYFASFKKVAPGVLQVEGLKNGLPERYHGYCITCALIPQVAAKHQARIQSSRSLATEELRTDAATRAWKRMVREGTATYDPDQDRFYHPPLVGRLTSA